MENPLLLLLQAKSNLHGSHGWQNPVKFFVGIAELHKYIHGNAATSPRVSQNHEGKGREK